MSAVTSKVRIYDLAKDLRIDTKRLIEEVRREGVDVSVPSNSVSKELAAKLRERYFPSKPVARAIRKLAPAARADVTVPSAGQVRVLGPAAEASPVVPRQVRVLRPTAAALNAGIRPGERAPAPPRVLANRVDAAASESPNEEPVEIDSQAVTDSLNQSTGYGSKVRIYELAKELKIDTKRLIEEVRREGVDVSVPSNHISKELALKIREKYFPKKDSAVKRTIRVVKKAARPTVEEPPPSGEITVAVANEVKSESESTNESTEESSSHSSEDDLLPLSIDPTDDVLQQVKDLVSDYAGVILTGPPGTSKTWYARQIAAALTERDKLRVRFVQFHPSYQYEDFVEGYVPRKNGKGFDLRNKHLLEMCRVAREHVDKTCVLVIDELSRSDPGRVFGEALTYIEPTQREVEFCLASGKRVKIPRNLFFIATMNPLDRGVDEVDAALDRRFAKIAMDPSPERLTALLKQNEVNERLINSVVNFFNFLLVNRNERCRVGHAYFRAIRTEGDLRRLWDHQLRFHMEKAFQVDREAFRLVEEQWIRTFPSPRERER